MSEQLFVRFYRKTDDRPDELDERVFNTRVLLQDRESKVTWSCRENPPIVIGGFSIRDVVINLNTFRDQRPEEDLC